MTKPVVVIGYSALVIQIGLFIPLFIVKAPLNNPFTSASCSTKAPGEHHVWYSVSVTYALLLDFSALALAALQLVRRQGRDVLKRESLSAILLKQGVVYYVCCVALYVPVVITMIMHINEVSGPHSTV